ncbi:MAG: sensor diguanylate cyclase/phosphodiesterase PAS PAS and PAC domain-containing [Rhodospirillaceae bacterium]|nr:MAG: sensor diguanylate cyclase/phosphodiesterase PAS PAS and PAC domain-containing [Rhodospirillaceae bacterium]
MGNSLAYQLKVDLFTQQISGYETLLRWNSAKLGLVSPAEFIPVAGETGLIISIGEWVRKTACAQVEAWHAAGLSLMQVTVNLSAR